MPNEVFGNSPYHDENCPDEYRPWVDAVLNCWRHMAALHNLDGPEEGNKFRSDINEVVDKHIGDCSMHGIMLVDILMNTIANVLAAMHEDALEGGMDPVDSDYYNMMVAAAGVHGHILRAFMWDNRYGNKLENMGVQGNA